MQPFEGIRVLDFTHVLAGPFAAYQLAVMGADVIKIEDPNAPDMMRPEGVSPALNDAGLGTRFQAQGGNKRMIAVDLKSEAGRDIILRLVDTADVVISNFRTGTMERLELDAEMLTSRKPDLIWCTMTGFGATGPKADHPAYDNVVQAYSGLVSSTGHPGGLPVKVGPPVLDYGTGAQAAFAIAAALFQRTRTGKGQKIDVSMLDAALMLMTSAVSDSDVRSGPMLPHGNSDPIRPAYGLFETADGQLMIGAFTNRQVARLWRTLGNDARAREAETRTAAAWQTHGPEDRIALQAALKARTAQDWEDVLNAAGVPAARLRDMYEAMTSVQVASRDVLQPGVVAPETGRAIATPVAAFSYADGTGPKLHRPTVARGADTAAVLEELGMSAVEISALRADGVINA
ncbi:MAG: CaiB/BaiF CoA-transferase family protein [Pseudomonadota bacterium]